MNLERESWRGGIRWFTALCLVAVIALNVAGIWGIAVSRRGVLEQAARIFRLETEARAREVESLLSSTRADLVFLAGSPSLLTLETALFSDDPREARWARLGAEGALLLFLRGHPEVLHLVVKSARGAALVTAGRRGGVPVLWRPSLLPPQEDPADGRVLTLVDLGAGPGAATYAVRLAAEIDPVALVAAGPKDVSAPQACALRDAGGRPLAGGAAAEQRGDGRAADRLEAEAVVRADGWSAASPWTLSCAQLTSPAVALLEPLATRYRLTLGLNLAVMALALLLGSFAIQQGRRRERLEARSREEALVREVERQLFHSERLSTVGRLAAGMAHEINNPLEGMSNYLSLAAEAAARDDASSVRRHLESLRQGLERAAAVVRQILAHSDPARAPRTPLDLYAVVRQSVEFVGSRKEFQSIRFDLDLDPAGAEVMGNHVLLGQVFLNVLLNACEAQPAGGEVLIRARREAGDVILEVADRGPGVPPGEAARIFEPFYSTKRSTGLGLSTCYAIVKQHDGDMSVAARPGGGAVFRVRFPAARPRGPAQEA